MAKKLLIFYSVDTELHYSLVFWMDFDIRNVSLQFIKVYTFRSSDCSIPKLLIFLLLTVQSSKARTTLITNLAKHKCNPWGQDAILQQLSLYSLQYHTGATNEYAFYFDAVLLYHSWVSKPSHPESSHTQTCVRKAHPLSSITLFALSLSLEKNSICARCLLMWERTEVGKYSTPTQWLA